ncbi:MAG: hypothetical protein HY720_07240 [Planctomycetes bacterium]|nr:hypothetical protein [Planctomycetota bacterium]
MMRTSMTASRFARAAALSLALVVSAGCAFEEGYRDGLTNNASKEYGWGHEIYEMPLGLVGIPVFVVLSPFIAPIPAEDHGAGYLLGDTWAGVRILLDPTVNYGG